jgi:ABC-type polysaccharide/polyol phosphate export systems, permease component
MTNKFRKITPNGEVVLTYLNPLQIIFHLFQYRALIQQFTKREIISRYKGSFIGIGWSFIYPLLMLGIYTFVFSIIFNAKWPINTDESTSTFH